MDENPDSKSQLVTEICSISSKSAYCAHRRRHPRKSIFIDWYLLLQVDEDAAIDVIRKRYRQLALLLHPDKNRHPKAEIAFKLVSEAYTCLSDKAKRRSFNSERRNNFCKECNRKCLHIPNFVVGDMGKSNRCDPTEQARRSYRAVQQALKEEANVIDNCLRAHAAYRKESPLFDPSDYVHFSNYPHHRIQILKKSFSNDFRKLRMGNVTSSSGYGRGTSCESPVYEIGSQYCRPEATQYRRTERRQFRAA